MIIVFFIIMVIPVIFGFSLCIVSKKKVPKNED